MDDLRNSDVTVNFFRQMVQCALATSERPAGKPSATASIDWDYLYKLAEAHGLLSLFGMRLPLFRDFQLPAEFSKAVTQYAQANRLRNRMLLQEYEELRALFQQAGIQVVALKGIAAIQRDADYALIRELADIDFLIDPQQVTIARKLLEERGYHAVYAPNTVPVGADDLNSDQAKVYARVYHEFSFASADGLVYVDMHWRLSPSVYPTGIPASLAFNEVSDQGALLRPYELVYLCTHAAKDGWSELKWAVDVACLIRQMTAQDWESAWQLALRFRSRRALLTGIALAEWLTGRTMRLPGTEIDKDYWPSSGTLARLSRRLMHDPERKHRLVSCLGLNKTYLSLCDSTGDQLIYVFRMFTYPQPRDFVRLGLTPALLPVWSFLRPFVITAHCMKRAIIVLFAGRTRHFGE